MKDRPNIIIVVMDTVRYDHLSCYGYQLRTTPNIDKIARRGILYENAFAAAPWTPPSHASLFTGEYPSHHKTIGKNVRFKEENTSLAEVFSNHGYQTIGITSCSLLGPGSGFEKGFQHYIELELPSLSISGLKPTILNAKEYVRTVIYGPDKCTYKATETVKSFIRRNQATNKPFFVFVNYFNCHTPYDPPRPFKKSFCPRLSQPKFYLREMLWNKILDDTAERISAQDLDIRRLRWIASGMGGYAFAARQASISSEEWDAVRSWYDGEIAYLDHQIGNLIGFLDESDALDDTLVVITSDHGENFGEHGLAVHPLCVYDSLLHIPLIISHAELTPPGEVFSSLVSNVDIFPTLMELGHIELNKRVHGRSLHPFEDQKIHDFVCAEYGGLHTRAFGDLHARKLGSGTNRKLEEIDVGYKCIRTLTHKYTITSLKEELYDIQSDPLELVNVAEQHPQIAGTLRKQLMETVDISYFGPEDFSQSDRRDKEMVDRLKALGYI